VVLRFLGRFMVVADGGEAGGHGALGARSKGAGCAKPTQLLTQHAFRSMRRREAGRKRDELVMMLRIENAHLSHQIGWLMDQQRQHHLCSVSPHPMAEAQTQTESHEDSKDEGTCQDSSVQCDLTRDDIVEHIMIELGPYIELKTQLDRLKQAYEGQLASSQGQDPIIFDRRPEYESLERRIPVDERTMEVPEVQYIEAIGQVTQEQYQEPTKDVALPDLQASDSIQERLIPLGEQSIEEPEVQYIEAIGQVTLEQHQEPSMDVALPDLQESDSFEERLVPVEVQFAEAIGQETFEQYQETTKDVVLSDLQASDTIEEHLTSVEEQFMEVPEVLFAKALGQGKLELYQEPTKGVAGPELQGSDSNEGRLFLVEEQIMEEPEALHMEANRQELLMPHLTGSSNDHTYNHNASNSNNSNHDNINNHNINSDGDGDAWSEDGDSIISSSDEGSGAAMSHAEARMMIMRMDQDDSGWERAGMGAVMSRVLADYGLRSSST